MKTVQEIIKQKPVYLHNWQTKFDVIREFEDCYITKSEYRKAGKETLPDYAQIEITKMKKAIHQWIGKHILFASYGTDNYSGDAFVLFEQGGKLYEVNASHCS